MRLMDADRRGRKRVARLKKDVKRAVRPVLYADQVAVFERALRATGIVNRGEALIAVCQAYLASHPTQSGGGESTLDASNAKRRAEQDAD